MADEDAKVEVDFEVDGDANDDGQDPSGRDNVQIQKSPETQGYYAPIAGQYSQSLGSLSYLPSEFAHFLAISAVILAFAPKTLFLVLVGALLFGCGYAFGIPRSNLDSLLLSRPLVVRRMDPVSFVQVLALSTRRRISTSFEMPGFNS